MKLIPILILCLLAVPSFAVDVTTCQNITSTGTYVLQNNISSDGSCLLVTANDVTVDLNGYTITYDNAAPFSITNGSFELSDLSGWNLIGAPVAVREAGTYLGRTVYEGQYAMKIPAPLTQDQTMITGSSYTLKAGMAYSASVMMWQPYDVTNAANADIHMVIEIIRASDNAVLAARDLRDVQASYTTRGFQYVRAVYISTEEVAVKIRLKVTGGRTVTSTGQAPYGAFYFDDVRLQQTGQGVTSNIQLGNAGVQFGGSDVQYGVSNAWGRRGTVTSTNGKGKIIQGQGHGDFSDAVIVGSIPSDLGNYTVNNLEITVSGNSTHAVWASNAPNGVISNNTIVGNNDTIEIRDHYDGALIYVARADPATGVACKIFNNIITNGIQTGIYVAGSPSATMLTEIYNNDITLQSKYTNDFAIVGGYGTYSAYIHDNAVHCGSGNNTCRGIFIHGNYGSIIDNTVDVHYDQNNQEYGLEYAGCGGATYGIQVDPASSNILVSGNVVTANADTCDAAAFRFYAQPAGSTTNLEVSGNTFKAISISGTNPAASVRILETYTSDMTFTGNVFETNSVFLFIDGNVAENADRSLTMTGNTFKISYPKSALYYPLLDNAYVNGSIGVPKNVSILLNTYDDATARSDMANAVFKNYRNSYTTDTYVTGLLITELGVNHTPPTSILSTGPRVTARTLVNVSSNTGTSSFMCADATNTCTPSSTSNLLVYPGQYVRYYSTDGALTETTKSTRFAFPRKCN